MGVVEVVDVEGVEGGFASRDDLGDVTEDVDGERVPAAYAQSSSVALNAAGRSMTMGLLSPAPEGTRPR